MTTQTKNFQRTTENFVCEKCGQKTVGNGYTNHCPKCLYSKHVDINPGDRANICGGLMKPVGVEKEGKEYMITHECIRCGFKRRNRVSASDDFDEVVRVSVRKT